MNKKAYCIWISHALGAGNSKLGRILRYAGSVEDFYSGGMRYWASMGIFTQRELQAMKDFTPQHGEYQLEYCEKLGQSVITLFDPEYPDALKNIYAPPCVLYVKGKLPDFDKALTLGVVGAREATPSGIKVTESIVAELAKRGVITVSGGAMGIDGVVHETSMKFGGVTVAFLGCGINYPYLIRNASLREEITQNGALISEYAPDVGVERGNFPVRNRMISGISDGLLVTEAGIKSGTSSTVRYALDQGKDVFAVPGDPSNEKTAGTNNLIKSGAIPVTCAEDIWSHYEGKSYKKIFAGQESGDEKEAAVKISESVSDDAMLLFNELSSEPVHIRELQERLNWTTGKLLSAITELEISGYAQACSGRRYRRI